MSSKGFISLLYPDYVSRKEEIGCTTFFPRLPTSNMWRLLYKMHPPPSLKDSSHCSQRGCQSPRKEKVCGLCSWRKLGGVVCSLPSSLSVLELSAALHLWLWLVACKFHIVRSSLENSRVCKSLVIFLKCTADVGLHTNDFPMDRISGLTT